MDNFFRYNPDGSTSINMFFVWILTFISIYIAFKYKKNKKLLHFTINAGLFFQLLMFYWYLGSGETFLKEGLPLFHCRISAIFMGIGYYFKKPKISRFFSWLGIIGALIAFSFPDPSPYMWPHVTNITYVCSHILLITSGILTLSQSEERVLLKDSFIIAVVMNIFLECVNFVCKANYGYLTNLPSSVPFELSKMMLFILLTILMTLIIERMDVYTYRVDNAYKNYKEKKKVKNNL